MVLTPAPPIATDAMVAAASYLVSDAIAQHAEHSADTERSSPWDQARTTRYCAFGFCDGIAQHEWFGAAEAAAAPFAADERAHAAVQVVLDALVFSPVWVAAFLLAMSALQGKQAVACLQDLSENFSDLYTGDLAAWLPANAFIYSCVPLQLRVAAVSCVTLCYIVVLSAWNNGALPLLLGEHELFPEGLRRLASLPGGGAREREDAPRGNARLRPASPREHGISSQERPPPRRGRGAVSRRARRCKIPS